MPLIDLKTNLKNIRFGNDQPGYGSSGLPYIQTQIPDTLNATGTFKPIFRPGSTGNLDFPIRGGDIKFNIGTQTFTLSSEIDKTRIRKFFEDKPRGTAFIQKQIGLQLSNPKIETGNSLYNLQQTDPLPGLLENTRIYNKGINTLAQVGASGTGAHAVRHGTLPFNPLQKNYYSVVNSQNVNDDSTANRLLILNRLKMTSSKSPIVDIANVGDTNRVNTLGISLNRNILFQYLGGPGSVYGVGNTTINRAVDTTKLSGVNGMSYDQIMMMGSNSTKYKSTLFGKTIPTIQDFRDQIVTSEPYTPWGNNEVDKRFYVSAGSYKDKMNLLAPFVFNNNQAPWEINKDSTDDLIKFVFEAISNDDPSQSMALFFRAFLTAGLTDNNAASLSPFKYAGRGENFYTYQGFDRTISFSFRVAAGSREELKPLYNKVNALISQVYPDYSTNQGIMRAPVVRLTLGDYLYRVPGFLESVNVTVDNNYPWEVNIEDDETGNIAQLPQVLDVAVSFKPVMDILPRRAAIRTVTNTTTLDSAYGYTGTSNNVEVFRDETTVSTDMPALIANVKYGPKENPRTFIDPGTNLSTNVSYRTERTPYQFNLLGSLPKTDFRTPFQKASDNSQNVLLKSAPQFNKLTRDFKFNIPSYLSS